MNCDQVFSILTRGPFPTGASSDVDVEFHLERCDGCSQIAEALRPAHDIFEESIPAIEARDLPGYWGDVPLARSVYAQVQVSTLRTATMPRRRVPSHLVRFSPSEAVETIGWEDIARIASFLMLLTGVTFGMAWLWQSY